jgi:hypothetical protein
MVLTHSTSFFTINDLLQKFVIERFQDVVVVCSESANHTNVTRAGIDLIMGFVLIPAESAATRDFGHLQQMEKKKGELISLN